MTNLQRCSYKSKSMGRRTTRRPLTRRSKLDPGTVTLRGSNAGLDESHTLHTVIDGRINHRRIDRHALLAGIDGARSLGVDRGEGFEVAFRMSRWDARNTRRGRTGACAITGDQAL